MDGFATSGTTISSTDLANTSTAASYLKSTYYKYYWKRSLKKLKQFFKLMRGQFLSPHKKSE